jgi:glycosyltransferase involved in cell wall biosynthesis
MLHFKKFASTKTSFSSEMAIGTGPKHIPMHLLKIIHGYPPTYNAGSEVYSQSICHELSQQHRVSIFTREENPFHPDFEIREEQQTPQRSLFLANMPRGKDGYRHAALDAQFGRLLDQLKPDIAHIGHLNHLSTGLVDELHARGIPIVFTLHDFWLMCPRGQFLQRNFGEPGALHQVCDGQDDRKCATSCYAMYFSGRAQDRADDEAHWTRWIASRMEETRSLADKVAHFIAPSRYLRQRFIEDFGLSADKVQYLDYGFPLQYLTPQQSTPPKVEADLLTFGYIGTHIPAKGIHHLIEAFGQVQGKARLRIWGRPRTQETVALQALAEALVGTDNIVEWMGEYVNQHIADHVLSRCDGIVVPSIWGENSPLVIHEAQACRVPVITADYGGMKEYVRHQENGLLFRHRDPADLAKHMQWAVNHPEAFRALGQRGYLYAEDGRIPDIRTHCQQLIQVYRQILQQHGKRILATNA